jgi:hypothetical protein
MGLLLPNSVTNAMIQSMEVVGKWPSLFLSLKNRTKSKDNVPLNIREFLVTGAYEACLCHLVGETWGDLYIRTDPQPSISGFSRQVISLQAIVLGTAS